MFGVKGNIIHLRQYFNSVSYHVVRDIMRVTQERQAKFEANVLAKLTQVVATQQLDVGS